MDDTKRKYWKAAKQSLRLNEEHSHNFIKQLIEATREVEQRFVVQPNDGNTYTSKAERTVYSHRCIKAGWCV